VQRHVGAALDHLGDGDADHQQAEGKGEARHEIANLEDRFFKAVGQWSGTFEVGSWVSRDALERCASGGSERKGGEGGMRMRRFVDRDGMAWDVVLGRESWGDAAGPVRARRHRCGPAGTAPGGGVRRRDTGTRTSWMTRRCRRCSTDPGQGRGTA
jgi:hypothetical protein